MHALEIINALNDPDNPAKPKGLNAKLGHRPTQGEKLCLGRGELENCTDCVQASAALDRRASRNEIPELSSCGHEKCLCSLSTGV